MSSPEPIHHSGNVFAILIDCALAAAIVAAYIPQLRQLRKSTTSETPSNDGLSAFYIFFHGIFCTNLFAMAILMLWAARMNHEYTPLATLNSWLHVAPMFAQWLCGMAVTITYVAGHQRGEGKCLVPLIVWFHAAFVLLFSQGSLERHDSMTSGILGMLVYIAALFSAPFVLVGQPWAQWCELRQRRDFGALNVRSMGLQAAVMGAMAVRLMVHFGWPGWAMLFTSELRLGERFAAWLQWHFMEVHYLLWVAGAVTVWLKTRANKSEGGENVELGSLLD